MRPVNHKLINLVRDVMPFVHGKPGQRAVYEAVCKAYKFGVRRTRERWRRLQVRRLDTGQDGTLYTVFADQLAGGGDYYETFQYLVRAKRASQAIVTFRAYAKRHSMATRSHSVRAVKAEILW
jgi:hypothetical protein